VAVAAAAAQRLRRGWATAAELRIGWQARRKQRAFMASQTATHNNDTTRIDWIRFDWRQRSQSALRSQKKEKQDFSANHNQQRTQRQKSERKQRGYEFGG
jgi:hypothetical protein